MNTYSIFDRSTGRFTGEIISVIPDMLDANVPDGCSAVVGEYDCGSFKFDLESGLVVELEVSPELAGAEAARVARLKRGARLAACDWVVVKSMEMGVPVPPLWIQYREALRNMPEQDGFPTSIEWPMPPSD